MILPTKHLRADRALLGLGAEVLSLLDEPKTVSRLWEDVQRSRQRGSASSPVTFDWFILALDLLYGMDALVLDGGLLRRQTRR